MGYEAQPRSSTASPIRVSDLDLASYLVAEGARLVGIAATVDPARRVFVLQGSPELIATATQRFNAGDALVEPRSFSYARRFLRRALDLP
jgi:hypothetical protein